MWSISPLSLHYAYFVSGGSYMCIYFARECEDIIFAYLFSVVSQEAVDLAKVSL